MLCFLAPSMMRHRSGRAATRLALLLLLGLLLISQTTSSVLSDNVSRVNVSPGKYDLTLGAGFPGFGPVKLSYPNSSILTNSVGDLLFTVTLNPLMLNPLSAQVWSPAFPNPEVQVWGSGFSTSDTGPCTLTLSGGPVDSPTCTISGGILTGSFNVPNVLAGAYMVNGTNSQKNDYSLATFTVLPPSLVLNPSSGPAGTTVSVSGFGFYSTDTSCTLTGVPVPTPPPTCLIVGGILTPFTFVVPAVAPGTYTIAATTNGDDSGEAVASFTVTTSPQFITLSASSGLVGAPVGVSGSHFLPTDAGPCTLIGNIIAAGSTCSIAASGLLTGSFTVGNVAPGVYTVTARALLGGIPGADSATANFQLLPSPPLPPTSATVSLDVYIPTDFAGLTLSKAWTSFTNNYDSHIFSLSRLSGSDQIGPNWWKVSVKNLKVTRPTTLVEDQTFAVNETQYIRLFMVTSPSIAGRYFFKAFINGISIGPQNFPTIVVKGSRDPAYVSGVLRDSGERDPSLAGQPIQLPTGTGAQVLATGIDYLGRSVSAQAFINSTAFGSYTLFGVAPGTYNLTAYAAGYIPATRPTRVNVGPTQSLEAVDIYLTRSPTIAGTVLSENCVGSLIPWGTLFGFNGNPTHRAITVDLVNLNGGVVASTAPPYGVSNFTNPSSTSFAFAIHGQLGFDGRIPQNLAGYTSGLTSGDYLLYAFVTSYIQLAEVRVHLNNQTDDTSAVIPLIRSGIIDVTVHFRDQKGTIGIGPPYQIAVDSTLTVSAYDQGGILRAQNVTSVKAGAESATVELQGFSNSRGFGIASLFSQNYGLLPGTYQIIARVSSSPSFAGFANLGIRDFYYQTDNVYATIGLGCQGVVSISFSVYKAGGLELTIYSIDDQTPLVGRLWGHPGVAINFLIIGSNGVVYQANATQPSGASSVTFTYLGLQTDNYSVLVQTLGYTQKEILHLSVALGNNADALVWMIKNPVIDLTVFFRDEGLLSPIDSTQAYAQPINHLDATPARIEVFDGYGNFVAANASYIPNNNSTAHFILAGFDRYFGDPRFIWSGFYDTTDGAGQSPGGLFLYPWDDLPRVFTIRIWVDGYYQMNQLQVFVPAGWNVSVVEPLDRATRISGYITGPDLFELARPLSWAAITLEPNNYALTGIIDVRPGNYTTYSLDGYFQVWVPGGSYGMGVSLAGYSTYAAKVEVPSGSDINMQIWLSDYQPS